MVDLGDYTVEALHDGLFALDGGAMFGVVPRTLWQKTFAPDDRNRITLALRCLLVRGHGRTILVDTGLGSKWDEKSTEMYAIDRKHALEEELAARGIARDQISDVILTHLHFDHAGGATRKGDSGAAELTFPRATYHVQRRNADWARQPSDRDRGSYRPENFDAVLASRQLRMLEGEGEILPGIRALPSDGHTIGLQMIRIEGTRGALVYPADVVPTGAHLRAVWGTSYDLQPLELMREKRALLRQAAAEKAVLVFEHDPRVRACTLREERGEAMIDTEVRI